MGSLSIPPAVTGPALDYLLAAAGLDLTEAQKADLQSIHESLAAMKARVRQGRGHRDVPTNTITEGRFGRVNRFE